MKLLFLLILSSGIALAQISTIAPKVPVNQKGRSTSLHGMEESNLLRKLKEQSTKIAFLLETNTKQVERPLIWDGSKKLEATKVIRGILLNSVVSTNLESPLLIQALPNDSLPVGTKFRCSGVTKNKRVLTLCDLMITPTNETSVKVQALNLDGSAGLRGVYNDGKDSYIAGAVISDFAKGIISASKSKLILPLGVVDDNSEKNKILDGLANSAGTTTDVLMEEMKSQEPKVFIEAGKPVLLFFMEGINAY